MRAFRNHKLFVSMLLSYLVLSMIPLTAALAGFQVINRLLTENTYSMSRYSLDQFRIQLEANIEKGREMLDSFTGEKLVQEFSKAGQYYQGNASLENIYLIQSKMRLFDSAYGFMEHSLLSFVNSGITFFNGKVFLQEDRLYGEYMSFGDLSFNEFSGLLRENRNVPEFSVQTLCYLTDQKMWVEEETLCYIRDFYKTGEYVGKVFGFIPFRNINSLADAMDFSNGGYVVVSDAEGRILYHSGLYDPAQYKEASAGSAAGSTPERLADGSDIVFTSVQSERSGWNYDLVIPAGVVLEKVNEIRNAILLAFLLTGILLSAAAFAIACRRYAPIRNISNMLDEKEAVDFTKIQNSLSAVLKNNQSMRQEIVENQDWIRTNLYQSMLHGGPEMPEEITPMAEKAGIAGEGAYSMFSLYLNSERETKADPARLENFNLKAIIGRFLKARPEAVPCYYEYGSQKAVVLYEGLESGEDVERIALGLKEELQSLTGCGCFLSADICKGMGELYRSAGHCEIALRQSILSGEEGVLWYRSDMKGDERYFFPLDSIQKSVNMLLQGNIEEVKAIYEELYHRNMEARPLFGRMLDYFINDLKGKTITIIYEISDKIDVNLELYENRIQALELCTGVREVFREMYTLLEELCGDIIEIRVHEKVSIFTEAVAYVEEHYADPQLNLGMAADRFQFTIPYFSVMFKKCTGYNFSNYVENKRIERAAELLKGDEKVGTIAARVGYNSELTFRNAFKRVKGMTPGEYRKHRMKD